MPNDPLDPEFQLDVPGVGAVPTQVPPAEVVRRGIVRAEMPIYGAAGVIGVQQMMTPSDDVSVALGAGAQ